MHGESIILFDDIYSSSISDQRYVSPDHIERQVICHPDGVALGLEHKETLILHVMKCNLPYQVDNVFVFIFPSLTINALLNLQIDPTSSGVSLQPQTPVHVGLVPEAAVVLQPPQLPVLVLLVGHPAVVVVWLHSQHSTPL